MKFAAKATFLTAALAALILPVAGQTATPPAQPPTEVGQRQQDQQNRINNGVQNGTLDSQQAQKLDNRSDRIGNEINKDRAANGGHLTAAEKQHINQQQNHLSHKMNKVEHK
jgi:hypothetical protein